MGLEKRDDEGQMDREEQILLVDDMWSVRRIRREIFILLFNVPIVK